MNYIKKILESRTFKLCIVIIIQVFCVFFIVGNLVNNETVIFNIIKIPGSLIYNIMLIVDILLAVSIFANSEINPVYKITWIIILAAVPIIGTIIYLLWGDRQLTRRKALELNGAHIKSRQALEEFEGIVDASVLCGGERASAAYLQNYADAPVFKNTYAEYYPWGEIFFESLLQELEKAEKFIFIEYFIIKTSYMWDKIYSILEKKAREGVEVRLVYDAIGSIVDVPENFWKEMRKKGIKCYKFNPIKFSWKLTDYTFLNHRDHRKICVIDGNVGFTGGINISDEYINRINRIGKWKDTAVMLKGDAVFSLTCTFLKIWGYVSGDTSEDYKKFAPTKRFEADYYLQPYDDDPLDSENVSENSYFNVIYHARKYVYITTPYIIIDNEMATALALAAKSGVDVRIIMPHIPDKKLVYLTGRSYYPQLIEAGVKIYEFMPGFIHSKVFVSDGKISTVGTVNLDFRSLYLHYECGTVIYDEKTAGIIKEEYLKTLKICRLIKEQEVTRNLPVRMLQAALRIVAPLM